MKSFEGQIIDAIAHSTATTGNKHAEGVTIDAATLAVLIAGEKDSSGYYLRIDAHSTVVIDGTKVANGQVELDIGTILEDLLYETIKTGDIEAANAISTILTGTNLDSSHIARLDTILGTVNLRYTPITGVL
jgi:hypothetical protein